MSLLKLSLFSIPLVAIAGVAVSYFISPLHTFNTLVPKDSAGELAAEGIAYGENPRQQLDIYVPRNAGDGPRPVIVWFYGGSWNSGSRGGYAFAGRALAAQGFVTVVADYRLVPEVRFPGFVEDGAAAVHWVRANIGPYGGNGEQIIVAGHSAGAYIAAMLANDAQWLGEDRAAVAGFAGLAGPYDFYPFDSSSTIEAFGQWPDAPATQPITFADETAPPALLLTGADDTTVLPRNSEALAARLTGAGVQADMISYSEVGHVDIVIALAKPLRGRAPVLDDITNFARQVTSAE